MTAPRAGHFEVLVRSLITQLELVPGMYAEIERAAYLLRGAGGAGRTPIAESDPTGSVAVDFGQEKGNGLSPAGELREALDRVGDVTLAMSRNVGLILAILAGARARTDPQVVTRTGRPVWTEEQAEAAEERAHRRVRVERRVAR